MNFTRKISFRLILEYNNRLHRRVKICKHDLNRLQSVQSYSTFDFIVRVFLFSQDSHSDHLVKLFDKTLSTVTPVRDTTNETNGLTSRYRRGQPLPLILSDSSHEDDMPVLTLNDSGLSSNETKVNN